jgi:nucleoside-diphosphate-sugar epimerase
MTKNIIVGYSGFVGSNLLQFYQFDEFYNSKNFQNTKYKNFDTIFFSGIPAVKWYANKNPDEDNCIIENIKSILDTIKCKKFILISTIDVYNNTNNLANEDSKIDFNNNNTYGKNRYLFEKYIETKFENHFIIRLPALFGKGLKKNIIFDLIHKNQIENIPLNSSFQWYNLDRLKNDIDIIINNNIRICNLFTQPIETREIVNLFKKVYNRDYEFHIEHFGLNNNRIEYNTQTKFSNNFECIENGYICQSSQVLKDIEDFFKFTILDKSNLCVSNICINKLSQIQFACLLKLYGITRVQIAPTKIINNWYNIDSFCISDYIDNGVTPYSFQSITFTLDDLNIFNENRNKLIEHIKIVIDLAYNHNIKILIFGCPKNRKVTNYELNNDEIFIDFFKEISLYCKNKDIKICIENNSKQYNCNYLNTIEECEKIVRKIDKSNIKMMVDLGNAVMENDKFYYLETKMDIIHNIDISNPNMNNFVEPHKSNRIFKDILNYNKYNKNINLEMLIKDENELEILNKSLINFVNNYSNNGK